MSENIHIGDVGTIFKIKIVDDDSVAIDISDATTKQIIFLKPGRRASVTQTATFTTDGTDGYIEYQTVADDLDKAGLWKIQGKVIGPTYTNSSETWPFLVKVNN